MPAPARFDLAASIRYVRETCVPEARLPEVAGIAAERLDALRQADCMPEPTYRVCDSAVVSAIATLGDQGGRAAAPFYSPPVLWWLRRAAETQAGSGGAFELKRALQAWLAADLARALRRQAADAAAHGWERLVAPDGTVNMPAVADEAQTLWRDWMNGGWAVCLRRFDGEHLVTKEVERRRISRITDEGRRDPATLSGQERLDLIDAVDRLDAVLLPFAPHERPTGTPGLFIDRVAERYRLWDIASG